MGRRRDGGMERQRDRGTERRRMECERVSPSLRPSVPLSLCLLFAWRGSRTFLLRLTEFHNPYSGIDVIEKDVVAELAGAPGEGHVRTEALGVAGPQTGDLATLRVEVSAQFA